MAFAGADDLCSVVSTISSAFTALDDDGGDDDYQLQTPELKYIPPIVKTENTTSDITEDDIDDEFINRYLGDDGGNNVDLEGLPTTSSKHKGKAKKSSEIEIRNSGGTEVQNDGILETGASSSAGARRVLRKREHVMVKVENSDDSANDADYNEDTRDDDWGPGSDVDDDWRPGEIKKRNSTSRKGEQSGRKRKKKLTYEQRKEMSSEYKRKQRRREKLEKNLEDLVADDDFKEESFETNVRKRKRKTVSEMTPEEAEKERERVRAWRAKEKMAREALKKELEGDSEFSDNVKGPQRKKVSEATREKNKERIRARRAKEKEEKKALQSEQGDSNNCSGNQKTPTKRKRKRVCDMTPEEAEKERARARARRAREKELREALKSDATGESDASTLITIGRKKKSISEMTPEEREAAQEAWRRQAERRKARRAMMSSEKREAEKAKARERQRLKRKLAREGALPEDQLRRIEEQNRRHHEKRQAKRAAMTPEERREENQRHKMNRIARMARMTEEEERAWRMHLYMQKVAKQATLTPEEIERRRQHRREYGIKRYQMLKETLGPEGIRQMRRNYWHSMTPDRREKSLAKLRECHRRRVQKLKEEGRYEEVKKIWNERSRLCHQRNRGSRNADATEGSEKNKHGKPKSFSRKRWAEMTEEEREKKKEQRRHYVIKRKLAVQRLLDSGMTMEEIHQQTESPEQREQRLMRERIRRAKNNLRKRLENVGAPPEEIEQKVEELNHTFQPAPTVRPYKPRPDKWGRIDPNEIPEGLSDIEIKNRPINAPLLPLKTVGARPRSKSGNVKKEPSEPSPPRKRGRPFKYPIPDQSVATSSTTTTTTTSEQYQKEPSSTLQHSSKPTGVVPHQQQQQYSQYNTPLHYQHPPQPVFQFPHQVPPQPYSLQHILDGISYHEAAEAATSTHLNTSQPSSYINDTTSTTSSQHEYGGSYYGDETHSPPPASPGCGFEDSYSDYSYSQPEQLTVQPPHSVAHQSIKPEPNYSDLIPSQPKKPKKPRVRKYYYQPPKNPNAKLRTRKKDVIRNAVCDQCGQAYNRLSLYSHKNQMHNPNYDIENRKCRICGETYKHAGRWYSHYMKDHVKPFNPVKKAVICEECGAGFVREEHYKKHLYYAHGDGLKKENYLSCHLCPEKGAIFKTKLSYYGHLRRLHPDYVRPGHDCYRCEKSFPNEKALAEHVKISHPDCYFPCPYCTTIRFTQLGLQFHFVRCFKLTRQQRIELRNQCTTGLWTLEFMRVGCELCDTQVVLSSMTRHYKEVHNIVDDQYTCHFQGCDKEFRSRGFWSNHLYEKHQLSVEEIKEIVRKIFTSNREGMKIKPKAKEKEKKSPRRRKRQGKKKLSDDEEVTEGDEDNMWNTVESNTESEPKELEEIKSKRKKRKVIVIAEEDQIESENPAEKPLEATQNEFT